MPLILGLIALGLMGSDNQVLGIILLIVAIWWARRRRRTRHLAITASANGRRT